MSIVDRVLDSVKDLITLRSEVDEIKLVVRGLDSDVRNHESRIVRIETMAEMAQGRPTARRLPKR